MPAGHFGICGSPKQRCISHYDAPDKLDYCWATAVAQPRAAEVGMGYNGIVKLRILSNSPRVVPLEIVVPE